MSSRKTKTKSKGKKGREEIASSEYQAPFSLHPSAEIQIQDQDQAEPSQQDEFTPSSPYFDEQESKEALAWATGRNQEEAVDTDDAEDGLPHGAVSIGGRQRRDSQVGSYDDQGSIFDGPSAGAVPSSVSR